MQLVDYMSSQVNVSGVHSVGPNIGTLHHFVVYAQYIARTYVWNPQKSFFHNKNFDKDGVVFQCMPFSRNIFDINKHDIFSFPSVTILQPNLTDIRYKNQNGLFILYPEPWVEDTYGQWMGLVCNLLKIVLWRNQFQEKDKVLPDNPLRNECILFSS